jgi:hypothetical protein
MCYVSVRIYKETVIKGKGEVIPVQVVEALRVARG